MNLDVLKTEITDDPLVPQRGYSGMSDEAVATSLNDTIDRTLPIPTLTATEIFNAFVPADFDGLSQENKDEIWNLLAMGTLNPHGHEASKFIAIFGAGSATIDNLKAIRKRDVSRGVELGLGHVRPGNVQEARK